jgi:hypothetical protein
LNLLYKLNHINETELIITHVLCDIIQRKFPSIKSKLAYGVPFYYSNKRLCFVWPTSIPRSGVKGGVLLGFCQGHLIQNNTQNFRGLSNKVVRFVVYHSIEDINEKEINAWLEEVAAIDNHII